MSRLDAAHVADLLGMSAAEAAVLRNLLDVVGCTIEAGIRCGHVSPCNCTGPVVLRVYERDGTVALVLDGAACTSGRGTARFNSAAASLLVALSDYARDVATARGRDLARLTAQRNEARAGEATALRMLDAERARVAALSAELGDEIDAASL